MRRAAGEMSRATRHTRTPEPPQTSPAPPGAATRPSPPPIRPKARESGGGDDGAEGVHLGSHDVAGDPVAAALDSRRVPPRAARGDPSLNTDAPARRRLDIATNRVPRRRRRGRGDHPIATPLYAARDAAREGEGARPCPGGAPGRPARRGARVLGGPVPSTLFVIHEIPRATGCCVSGRRTRPPLISWLFSGRWVRSSLTSWALGGESFVYLLYLPPPTRASSLGVA